MAITSRCQRPQRFFAPGSNKKVAFGNSEFPVHAVEKLEPFCGFTWLGMRISVVAWHITPLSSSQVPVVHYRKS